MVCLVVKVDDSQTKDNRFEPLPAPFTVWNVSHWNVKKEIRVPKRGTIKNIEIRRKQQMLENKNKTAVAKKTFKKTFK